LKILSPGRAGQGRIGESCIVVVGDGAQFEQDLAVSDENAFTGSGELQPGG
jgi:hypothetical protein